MTIAVFGAMNRAGRQVIRWVLNGDQCALVSARTPLKWSKPVASIACSVVKVSRGAEKGALNRYLGLLFLYAHSRIVWNFAGFEVRFGRELSQHTIIRLDWLRGLARDTAFCQRYETIREPRDEKA